MIGLTYSMKKAAICFISLVLFVTLLNLAFATECRGTVTTDELPCQIFLPHNGTIPLVNSLNCNEVTVDFFINNTKLYSANMDNFTEFLCNTSFDPEKNRSNTIGSYVFRYSSGDSGSIIVEEGNNMIITIVIVVFALLGLLGITVFREDMTISQLASFGLMAVGAFIVKDGISTINNFFTLG